MPKQHVSAGMENPKLVSRFAPHAMCQLLTACFPDSVLAITGPFV